MKIEQNLDPEEVADFLRSLADVIAGGCEACLEEYGIDIQDFRKIKFGLEKGEGGELLLKIKVKDNKAYSASAKDENRQKDSKSGGYEYKKLKKRIKGTFSLLIASVTKGELPADGVMQSFLADSKEMITYPGYGDEFYEEYRRLCAEFKNAYDEKDRIGLKNILSQISSRKKECHDKYK